EAMMPLRLAKYGVPLADTGPAGLAAAGIEPALLLPAPASPAPIAPATEPEPLNITEHHRAEEGKEPAPGGHTEPEDAATTAPLNDPETTAVDFSPEIQVFPLSEPELGHLLDGLWHETTPAPTTRDHQAEEDVPALPPPPAQTDASDSLEPSATESATGSRQEPVPPPTASEVHVETDTDSRIPQQASLNSNGASGRGAADGSGQPSLWETSLNDTGEATARELEPHDQEHELDPLMQQIIEVAGWIEEKEAQGKKLFGAEAGRRLKVSPSTGQRRVKEAYAYRDEQRQQQRRATIRSVHNQR
ncbi:hypothetical protein ACQKIB_39950, partial [Streptomyces niveus]